MMTPEEHQSMVFAPELNVVNLIDDGLSALRLAILSENPRAEDIEIGEDEDPILRRARTVLRNTARLRTALGAYRREAHKLLRQANYDFSDLPF